MSEQKDVRDMFYDEPSTLATYRFSILGATIKAATQAIENQENNEKIAEGLLFAFIDFSAAFENLIQFYEDIIKKKG